MPTPKNFASELHESLPPVRLSSDDVQVTDIEIPPETMAPPPEVDTIESVPPIAPPPAPKKLGKALMALLPLIALGAGGYWFTHRNTEPETTGAPSRLSAPQNATRTTSPNKAQLKALWQQGAALKQRGDFAGARRVWEQGLKIEPQNLGFQESIAKLSSIPPSVARSGVPADTSDRVPK